MMATGMIEGFYTAQVGRWRVGVEVRDFGRRFRFALALDDGWATGIDEQGFLTFTKVDIVDEVPRIIEMTRNADPDGLIAAFAALAETMGLVPRREMTEREVLQAKDAHLGDLRKLIFRSQEGE